MKTANSEIYNSIKELKVHDHACMVYETKEEQLDFIIPFIKIGLECGEKCIYIVDDNTAQAVIKAIQKGGIDTGSVIQTGSLCILNKHDVYLKPGHFDPDWMMQFLKEMIDSAKAEGYTALRVTGEMTWSLGEEHTIGKLAEYESMVNNLFSENDILAICQYNSNRFTAEAILHNIHTHPIIIHNGLICKNAYYIPPEELLGPDQADLEVKRLLNSITERKQSERRLNAQHAVTQVLVESGTLREASPKIIQAVCMALEWDLGEIWIFDKQAGVLRNTEIWHRLSLMVNEFKAATKQITFPAKAGLPGRVYESAKPIWIEDVVYDTNFLRASIAEREGLHGAFGFPIIIGSEVLGTFCFFSRKIRKPDTKLLNMMTAIGRQIGLFIKRKNADMELEKSELKHSKLIEVAQDAILCDVNGTIAVWNKSAEKLFGYTKAEIIGKDVNLLVPEKYKKEHSEGLQRFLKTGEARIIGKTVEVSGVTKDGVEIPIEMSLAAQKLGPEQYYFMAIIRDLSFRNKQKELLLQSEKLRAMGMITAGIAHDFNNILAVISGCTQVLKLDNEDNNELMSTLRTIAKASDDGAEIVRRMSLFTKQKKGTSFLLPVDIKGVLKQAIEFVKPRWMNIAKAGGVDYDINVDSIKEVPVVMGIESELREVFINIMNNSMDAMRRGGCLAFRTWQDEENIFVSISDTGDGMSEEVLKRVFEPFYTTKREEGSGLGMSMSYGIIERHNGSIEIVSEEGKGTAFTIRLPITVLSDQQTELYVGAQEIKIKGLSVLVVDDKEDIRSLLEKFFARGGHTVKTVESGNRAVEMLNTEAFDLLLCDLVMPGMSGHEVVAALSRIEKRPRIGVMTGWSEKIETEDKDELNVDFIIRKPFKFPELIDHINIALGANMK